MEAEAHHPGVLASLREALSRLTVGGLRERQGALELEQVARQLEREADVVPNAGTLAQAVRRVLELPPTEAAPRLLKLLVALEQLGSDALPGPVTFAGVPLPTLARTATRPIPPLALTQLRAAIERRTTPPRAVLTLLADPATGLDPRVWPLLEAGLAHPFLRDLCAERIAGLGREWEPRLLEAFNRRGDRTDAARLRALVGLQQRRSLPLLRTCVTQASEPVRLEALEALLALAPEEGTLLLCARFDAGPEVHDALLPLLAASGRPPALRRLLGLLDRDQILPPAAFLRLPDDAMEGWLSLAQTGFPRLARTSAFFELLEHHPAPAAKAHLRAQCDPAHQPDPMVRRRAAEALVASADAATSDLLIALGAADPALESIAVTASFARGPQAAFETLSPRLETLALPEPAGPHPAGLFELPAWLTVTLQLLTPAADPRWKGALAPLVKRGHPLALRALTQLERAGPPASTGSPRAPTSPREEAIDHPGEAMARDGVSGAADDDRPLRATAIRARKKP